MSMKKDTKKSGRFLWSIYFGLSVVWAGLWVNGYADNILSEHFKTPPPGYRIIHYDGKPNIDQTELWDRYGIDGSISLFYDFLRDPHEPRYKDPSQVRPIVDALNKQPFQIWLVDEYGYPSGMAGGRLVKQYPEYEVRGLLHLSRDGKGRVPAAIDISDEIERIVAAVLYPIREGAPDFSRGQVLPLKDNRRAETEGMDGEWRLSVFALKIRDRDAQAQATVRQFAHTGRYPDLMNPDAMKRFIEMMYARQEALIGTPLAEKVKGFYTLEPNLMMVHWKYDQPGEYAYLPWDSLLAEKFKQMHGYDPIPKLGALYEGQDSESRRTRMHFHQAVAELLTDSFSRQINQWCADRGLLFSGHLLLNEYIFMHVACYGDLMKFTSEFSVPSIDIGVQDPDQMSAYPYHQVKLFSSIAAWKNREMFFNLLDPVLHYGTLRLSPPLDVLRGNANMVLLYGANQLSTYASLVPRDDDHHRPVKATGYDPAEFRTFNDYIGRLSYVLRGAANAASVALFYPIADVQAEYVPSTLHWRRFVDNNPNRQEAWDRLQITLLEADIDYTIIHPEALEKADIKDGVLTIGNGAYRYLVMPEVNIVSRAAMDKISQFEKVGGIVYWVNSRPQMGIYPTEDAFIKKAVSTAEVVSMASLPKRIARPYEDSFMLQFEIGAQPVSVARFRKSDKCIYFLVNRSEDAVTVGLRSDVSITPERWDPFTGDIYKLKIPADMKIDPFGGVLIIHPAGD